MDIVSNSDEPMCNNIIRNLYEVIPKGMNIINIFISTINITLKYESEILIISHDMWEKIKNVIEFKSITVNNDNVIVKENMGLQGTASFIILFDENICRAIDKLISKKSIIATTENDRTIIKYEYKSKYNYSIPTSIWDIIQNRVNVRLSFPEYNKVKTIVDILNSGIIPYDILIAALKSMSDNKIEYIHGNIIINSPPKFDTDNNLIEFINNKTAISSDIPPLVLLEAAIDYRDNKLAIDRHCGIDSD